MIYRKLRCPWAFPERKIREDQEGLRGRVGVKQQTSKSYGMSLLSLISIFSRYNLQVPDTEGLGGDLKRAYKQATASIDVNMRPVIVQHLSQLAVTSSLSHTNLW